MPTGPRRDPSDSPEVEAAERRIGAVLAELEEDTGGEVHDLGLEDVVDTDARGRPVVQKKVEVQMTAKPRRHWAR